MHYTIQFNPKEDGIKVADDKAIQDVKDWFGDKFAVIIESFTHDKSIKTIEQARLVFSFAGVQGYPVESLCRRYRPDIKLLKAVES